jgi:DNA-binding response OmpR family regulator
VANLTMPLSAASTSACVSVGAPVFGSRCWHALWATGNCGSLASGTTWVLGIVPSVPGSGKLDRPWERMQREKASVPLAGAEAAEVAVDEDPPPPPHPQTSVASPATAMIGRVRFMPQLYARAGDITATGDVGRMSSRSVDTDAMRVLVVEDHGTLAGRIVQGLRQAGMAVDAAYDGAEALAATALTAYDVIVLDRDLPVVHGDRVCRAVAGSGPRILMLTAAAGVDDRVDGLELGADDYLGKPFAFAELVARVRALSRRVPSAPPIMRRGDLTVDRARHRATRGGRPLSLTRKEFGVLETLLAADGALVSAEELLEHVWDASIDPFSNIVSVTLARLRRKLGDPPLIETVVGKGYRM